MEINIPLSNLQINKLTPNIGAEIIGNNVFDNIVGGYNNIGLGDEFLVKIGGYSDVSPRLSLNVNKITS